VLELSQRGLKPALPDVAPRTSDVRPDLDVHVQLLVESATNSSVAADPITVAFVRLDAHKD
jgi:hypothetical protein